MWKNLAGFHKPRLIGALQMRLGTLHGITAQTLHGTGNARKHNGHETRLDRLTYQLRCADVLIGWAAILAFLALIFAAGFATATILQ